MLRPPFHLPDIITGFHQYFQFNAETSTVLAALGYDFARHILCLPRSQEVMDELPMETLRRHLILALDLVSMDAEITRREFLMAPIILQVAVTVGAELHSEFDVDVTPQLHGSLDYLLAKEGALLVVEAKKADMSRGFTQLAAELVAVDHFADANIPMLYGAVTVGDIWRFGVLERTAKRVTQDISLFRVPADLESLLSVLMGILNAEPVS